jgi:hypothetical protein
MGILEGVAAIKATVEAAKLTSDLLNRPNLDRDQIRSNLSELLIHATNAHLALAEAQLQISDLRGQLEDKGAFEALKADIEHVADGGFLIKKSDKAAGNFIPYCPICLAERKLAIPLIPMANGYYTCSTHQEASYRTTAYREAEERRTAELRRNDSGFAVAPANLRWMG